MGFTDWLGLATHKSKEGELPTSYGQAVPVTQSPQKSFFATDEFSCNEKYLPKILMVQGEDYSTQITDCAIRIARRLSCAIIAVGISNRPRYFSGERKMRESDRFIEKARKSGEQFVALAKSKGIQATYVMDIGNTDEIIARMREHDKSIQYVLNRFVDDTAKVKQAVEQNIQIDALRCLQPQKQTHQ
jgi:gas vesicle protein